MHAVWSRRVNEVLAGRGLNFLSSYVWGRGASLGEPTGDVAAAAFAWFEPGFVRAMYDEGRSLLPRDDLLALRTRAAIEGLQEILAEEDVAEVGHAATCCTARSTRSRSSGVRCSPDSARCRGPRNRWGRLWRGCDLVREYRGDGHIAAVASTGLSPVEMNILTELWVGMPLLSYTATRAWTEEQMGAAIDALQRRGWLDGEELTEAGAAGRRVIEDRTDAAESGLVAALGSEIDALTYLLDGWGQLCIEADAFPPDPFKRWAG